MRYAVRGQALVKDGAASLPVGATVEASSPKEARKKALSRFGEELSGSGYAIKIDSVCEKNGGTK